MRVTATGQTYTLTGNAIVAADGVDSTVRHQLGIALAGEQGLNRFVNAYFHSDIERYLAHRSGVGFFIANADAVGALMPLDANGRWMCSDRRRRPSSGRASCGTTSGCGAGCAARSASTTSMST